jgi:hypothetical protein
LRLLGRDEIEQGIARHVREMVRLQHESPRRSSASADSSGPRPVS